MELAVGLQGGFTTSLLSEVEDVEDVVAVVAVVAPVDAPAIPVTAVVDPVPICLSPL